MNWWNRNKKFLILFLASFLALGALIVGILLFLGPIIGNKFCTMADCVGDGVYVVLLGEIPESYSVEIRFPSGKRKISCPPQSPQEEWQDQCTSNGVFFEQLDSQGPYDKPPRSLKVTVAFDEKKITQTLYPEYEVKYLNGEGCGPMCYFTTIEFDLSQ